MIQSKEDYLFYLESDRLAMKRTTKKPRLVIDLEWKFARALRKVEYLTNCKRGPIWKTLLMYYKLKLYKLGVKTGFSIPPNVFGPGIALFHRGTIIVSELAKVGADCEIHCSTNITGGVVIGNKVLIAPGVKILGNVTIADGVRIGANSVVSRSITESNITVVGAPAKKVSDVGTQYEGGTQKYYKNR